MADKATWTQRETLTTDGSGWWASGFAESVTASGGLIVDAGMALNISHRQDVVLTHNRSMLTLKILGGPGVGQSRMVTGWDKVRDPDIFSVARQHVCAVHPWYLSCCGCVWQASRTISLETPLDEHFVPGQSILAVVGSFGAKAIVGNRFNWTEVVQWYSNTLGGVMADNHLSDCNVLNGGNVGNASVGAYGACYNGPVSQPHPRHRVAVAMFLSHSHFVSVVTDVWLVIRGWLLTFAGYSLVYRVCR